MVRPTSMMLLRFSTDAGATYYNYEDPRKTVPFDRNSPRRKLDSHEANACNPATGDFINGDKCESVPLRTLSFRNMFQIRERGTILLDKNRSTVRVAIHRVSQSVSNILVRGALSRSATIYRRSRTSVITKPTVVKTCSVISFVSPTVVIGKIWSNSTSHNNNT